MTATRAAAPNARPDSDPGRPRAFEGYVALVTGGGKGIGRGIAIRLASLGADVGITYFRDPDSARDTVATLQGHGVRAGACKAFFGDPHGEEAARTVAWLESEIGTPTLLVSNAGTGVQRALADAKRTHWDWTMETHAVSFLELVKRVPALESVVAISSLGATRVLPGAYGLLAAAKAALESLVRYMAVELAPRCRVNAITPGLVETDAVRQFDGSATMFEVARARTPAGRLATPDDVAALATFVLSPDAAMITGQTIVVDGGYSLLM
jgi:enoyl-[acyl-carrier protein] reductase III